MPPVISDIGATFFPSSLAAKSFDPPLQKRRRPHHSHTMFQLTPAAAAGATVIGPHAQVAAVSKTDSVAMENSLSVRQEIDSVSFTPMCVCFGVCDRNKVCCGPGQVIRTGAMLCASLLVKENWGSAPDSENCYI